MQAPTLWWAFVALMTGISTMAPAAPRTIAGVEFAPFCQVGTNTLPLHGLALYRTYFFKVHAAALYLPPGTAPEEVLEEIPKRLEVVYLRGVPASLLKRHTRKGMENNLSEDKRQRIRNDLQTLYALFRDAQKGDHYALSYLPGDGLRLEYNGNETGFFDDPVFGRAMFALWLGRVPLNAQFKDNLLTPVPPPRREAFLPPFPASAWTPFVGVKRALATAPLSVKRNKHAVDGSVFTAQIANRKKIPCN